MNNRITLVFWYQFRLLKNLSIMSSVRSNLFVARYDAITDISSVGADCLHINHIQVAPTELIVF